MIDLDAQLRMLTDNAATPVGADEIIARHKKQENAGTVDDSRLAGRRWSRAIVAVSVAAVVVVVALLASSLTRTPERSPQAGLGNAHDFLLRAATLASEQKPLVPGPGQWLYTRVISEQVESSGIWDTNVYMEDVEQEWTSPTGPNASDSFMAGQPQFLTKAGQAAWIAGGSPPVQAIYIGYSPVYYDVQDLPTEPSQVGSYLASHATGVQGVSPSEPWVQFGLVAQFLGHGASSDQRAALLRYLATLPGVTDLGMTKALGTHESGMTLAINPPYSSKVEMLIDPSTSRMIEVRDIATSTTRRPVGVQIANGQALFYADYSVEGISGSSSQPSAGAPLLPAQWDYGTSRQPLPTVAYP
jgi:hypothetical protein